MHLDPKERITIPQIKQHSWYLGLKEETPRQFIEPVPEIQFSLSISDLEKNEDIISNLKLLGWEEEKHEHGKSIL